jgi:hypothetical protein
MSPFPLFLFAFGFGSLPMLGWLAVAAAPLLIHLWNKRRYRETSWAAMTFLMAALRKHARRIQIVQWLLLAVRTLLILLVVLATAEPYLESLGLSFVAGQRTHKVIVIDDSYSMAYRPTDSTRFARAQQLAAQIVEESPQGDGFTLVLLGAPPRVVIGTPAFETAGILEEIHALKSPTSGADLAATMQEVKKVLERARHDAPDLERSEVFFLTDLGRNTWVPEFSTAAAATDFRQLLSEMAGHTPLTILDLGQTGSDNVAVIDLKALEPYATLWQEITFQATIQNFGTQPRTGHLVELLVDDVRVKEQTVDLQPGGAATVALAHRFETPGFHVVRVRLGADLLEIDNSRWLSLPVKPQLKTLLVSGKAGSTRYLVDALDPQRSERSVTRPQVVPESALVEMDLDQFDAIFLCNIAQFTSGEARLLDAYVRQGGGLVFFLGDRVLADRYNRELAGDAPGEIHLLPAKLQEVVAEAQYRFDPLGYKHPLVSPFRGRERSGLLTTPVYRYFKLAVPEAWNRSSVALAFEGGDPAIVEAPHERGRVIVVATDGSLSSVDSVTHSPWSTMVAWPSFLPLVQELLALAVGSQRDQYNVIVGEAFGLSVPPTTSAAAVKVRSPGAENRELPVSVKADLDDTRWSFDKTEQYGSGIYLAHWGTSPPQSIPFAVNLETSAGRENSESNLLKADIDELPSAFQVQTTWQNLDAAPAGDIGRRSGLQRWLLYGAISLALVEMLLAWRFGRRGRA